MKEELEKQGSIMTQSSRNEKEDAYQKKMRDYQLLVNDTNEELKKARSGNDSKADARNN